MRPFFPFYGSKWNIARHYPKPLEGRTVIEPFAGSAGYATFYACHTVHLNDADPIVAGVWRYLIGAKADEIAALPEMPEVGDNVDNYALPQEAKWLIGFWLNRGSAQPKKSRTAYSARTDKAQLNWGANAKARIVQQLPLLAGWSISEGPYHKAPNVEATWFVDPPYGDKGKFYHVKFNDFYDLGEWCLARRGRLVVCEGAGAKWLPFTDLGSFKSTKGRAMEAVYARDTGAPGCGFCWYECPCPDKCAVATEPLELRGGYDRERVINSRDEPSAPLGDRLTRPAQSPPQRFGDGARDGTAKQES